ncbi:cytoskeleton protein RodZ [Ferrimonas sediminum]|uniref:Cytoskeleton protein RodZ n=1 Tax=Ferrimonas sediminum TaxID=718193 RepID=A0A1G8LZP4_9GAMM|nr:RodZ domain-containing protein [Ferrimonas sediminum]SDI61136.1 cytoskeleton protein RodZ [Ferrimonas sediminum]
MSENQQHQEQQEQTVITPGPLLKAAREANGLTTQQVAQRLSLRRSVVEGIENDDYESGTTTTYLRGYVRNYARLVGVSEQQIAQALMALPHSQEQTAMQSFSRRTSKQQRDSRWMLLTWVIALGLVGLLVWWWVTKPQSLLETSNVVTVPAVVQQATQPQSKTPSLIAASVETAASDADADSVQVPEVATEMSARTPKPAGSDAIEAAVTSEPQPASDDGVVTEEAAAETMAAPEPQVAVQEQVSIRLLGDCWMLLKDADGNTLMEGLKREGYEQTLSGKAPFKLRIGAPEVVALEFNGKSIDMSGYRPGKVAVITLAN